MTSQNQKLIKVHLPKTKDILNLKDHKIKLQYKDSNLSVEGLGKISLDKEFLSLIHISEPTRQEAIS